jgi:hypothetical protein
MALTKLTSNLIEGGTGTDWVTAIQTSNFTAAAGKGYFVNTTSQVLYVNLPVGVVGMEITIQDYAGTFATNKVILNANGSEKIQGSALEGRINTNNATAVLIYQDATKGWTSQDVELNATTISWATPTGQGLTYSTPNPQSSIGTAAATFPTTTFTATKAGSIISGTATIAGLPTGITAAQTITGSGVGNTLTVTLTGTFPATDSLNTALTLSGLTVVTPVLVSYLVVAGGAAGGTGNGGSGGGGAGGLLTNYSGTALTLNDGTDYLVTVGAGGAGIGNVPDTQGNNGSNSVFSTITADGGGGGGAWNGKVGKAGGSGGGGGASSSGTIAGGTATAGQGNSGGTGKAGGGPYSGGGGGGAGAAGQNATSGQVSNGGDGLAVSITGSSVTYAAGGGSGTEGSSYPGSGLGGSGGGGNGGDSSRLATSGTTNTGSGGGGGGWPNGQFPNGAGGSGIVTLRYPNSFTITVPGGLTATTTTVSTDKVTTFTAGTGNIQFN